MNFNELRKRACLTYDNLTIKLNESIDDETNVITIKTKNIQKEMDDLKKYIGLISMCYEDNDPNFIDVFGEIYNADETMVDFNKQF